MTNKATDDKALMDSTKAEVQAIRLWLEKLYSKLDDLDYDTMTSEHAGTLIEVKNSVYNASDFMRNALSEFRD